MNYERAIKAASMLIKSSCVAERFGNDQEAHDLIQQAAGAAKILATVYGKWEEVDGELNFGKVFYDMECAADLHGEEMAERFSL